MTVVVLLLCIAILSENLVKALIFIDHYPSRTPCEQMLVFKSKSSQQIHLYEKHFSGP